MTAAAMSLAPDPGAPQQARRFIAATLEDPGLDETREVAELLVSELVTNAVVHAASAVEVEIERDDSGVLVRVRDADTGPLVMRAGGGSELDEGGRGFLLVDRLAQAWGTEHHAGRKTVWVRLTGDTAAAEPARVPMDTPPPAAPDAQQQRLSRLLLPPSVAAAL